MSGKSTEIRRLSAPKKTAFALLATAGFFLVLELLLAACGVEPVHYREDPFVGFSSYSPLYVERLDVKRPQLVTAENKLTWFNEQTFFREKPDDGYRVFCLGGSTTYGRPYDDTTSFSGWLCDLKRIAIDEISNSKRHKYLTIVLDLDSGRVVFVEKGKKEASLRPFWKRLRASHAKIEAVAIDKQPKPPTDEGGGRLRAVVSFAYILAVCENLPKAVVVFDRFHIMKLSTVLLLVPFACAVSRKKTCLALEYVVHSSYPVCGCQIWRAQILMYRFTSRYSPVVAGVSVKVVHVIYFNFFR